MATIPFEAVMTLTEQYELASSHRAKLHEQREELLDQGDVDGYNRLGTAYLRACRTESELRKKLVVISEEWCRISHAAPLAG
jgi:hypothetical protein